MEIGRRWNQLSARDRRLVVLGAVVDGALKVAALADLRRRPPSGVRGRKWVWATVVALANSFGVVPLVYFVLGRRRDR
ncbi:hypothetical protein E4P40_03500 [Blastococcus sp. CT_GayMR20]|uniref:hypothetical protein n=1 Tax=Blastococcus sp. CT_GayMR20 TaxID=2559609 RepID=UPI001073A859|nr:hypothetical protein [Blastococcus sp. CT_GayMR20]TFV92275.1 hypothetical protein E4P40_03500 [Blastococcus sp. CT_GayMR20]